MKPSPHLHVIEGTGEVIECPNCVSLEERATRSAHDMVLQEREMRRLRRQIDQLRSKQHKDLRAHPRYALAFSLFDYWRERCDHPKAVFDDDRIKLVLTRLDHFDEEALKEAIDGAAEAAFVDKRGKRHDGFDLIFRNAEKVELFRSRAKSVAGAAAPTVKGVRVEGVVEAQLLVWGLELLNRDHDQPRDLPVTFDPDLRNDLYCFCPVCDDELRTLTMRYGPKGRTQLTCRNGCDQGAIRIILQDEAQRAATRRGLEVS